MRYAALDSSLGRRPSDPATSVFGAARAAGLDGVESCLREDYAEDPLWSLPGARATRAAADEHGLELPSLALMMLNRGGFAGDGPTRARAREIVRHAIDVAQGLGARTMLLPFFGAGKIEDRAAAEQVIEDCRGLAPAAEAAGVTLGLETTLPAPAVLDVLRAVGSPAVRAYFDVANAVWLGYDPVAELEALHGAGALQPHPQLHLKDVAERPADRPPGEGRVPYPAVAAALRRLHFDGYLVFETRPTDDPPAAARRHRAFIESLLEPTEPPEPTRP
jgi:L-ribulose-5-phosphate 3-epimerase